MRIQLTMWMGAIAFVIHLSLSLVAYFYQRDAIAAFFEYRFATRITNVLDAIRRRDANVDDDKLREIVDHNLQYIVPELWVVTVYDARGGVKASSARPAPPIAPRDLRDALDQTAQPPLRRRVAVVGADGGSRSLMRAGWRRFDDSRGQTHVIGVFSEDAYFERAASMPLQMLLFTLPAGVLAASVAGWLIAGVAVAPYSRLRRAAEAILPEVGAAPEAERRAAAHEPAGLEAELGKARDRLRNALLAQERFITNVSHELKTPIAILLTESQTMPEGELSPVARSFVKSVQEEMRTLGRMVEGFLTLTKVRGGAEAVYMRACRVNEIVMDAVDACRRVADAHHVAIVPTLSDAEPAPETNGEHALLCVMVENLIRNSVRFTPKGDRVLITVEQRAGGAAVVVRDFGPGIPEELLGVVFNRFVQAPSENQLSRGHGLGLSIAQGIAELHGGSISVRNLPDAGCEFTILLPVWPANPPPR